MNTLPIEIFYEILKNTKSERDIKNLCSTNQNYKAQCEYYKNDVARHIVKNILHYTLPDSMTYLEFYNDIVMQRKLDNKYVKYNIISVGLHGPRIEHTSIDLHDSFTCLFEKYIDSDAQNRTIKSASDIDTLIQVQEDGYKFYICANFNVSRFYKFIWSSIYYEIKDGRNLDYIISHKNNLIEYSIFDQELDNNVIRDIYNKVSWRNDFIDKYSFYNVINTESDTESDDESDNASDNSNNTHMESDE